MAFYETVFVTRPDLTKSDITKLTDEFTALIEQNGGKIVKNEYWGLRSLAYRIKKTNKGHYVLLGIDAPADAVKELNRILGINENIVRNLTVRVDAIETKPSAILNSDRDDGDYEAA